MVECRRLIIPVFFDVKPRDVRHQTGPFTLAFKRYRKKEKIDIEEVSKWKDALRRVGEISGYNLADTEGDEAKLIRLIVKKILTEVNMTSLFVTKHGVGLDSRIADVMKVLELEAHDDVKMVGIFAMGGMGKTTLAKAVYNQICSCFSACCFISNVREAAGQSSRLVSLQEQLLRSVCKGETFGINSTEEGIGLIEARIRRKKILLILDDVDQESQLDALAGSLDWFGSGSRIIVTTRDRGVLREPRVKHKGIYELKELDVAQSLELFSWHAFGAGQPVDDFAELAKEVAGTALGLPLALTIFGSLFFDLKTAKEWRTMLERLKEDQDKDIHERLKISFDALDVKEKKIFLDTACFFIEEERELATLMWEGCRFFPEIAIKVLVHKSLININDDTGEFGMHDHIRDMGRKIVQVESLPGMCSSRLWEDDDTTDALQNRKGTKDVEAIKRLWSSSDNPMAVEAKSFAAMPQLRMLLLGNNVRLEGEYELFPKTLKWLQWSIPEDLKSLPACVVHLENIVILDLSGSSSINQLWNPQTSSGIKVFEKLKVLNLSGCCNLMICPDFTSMPHLEELYFFRCLKLSGLHPSIWHLKCLTHLSLWGCESLEELPQKVGQLASLQVLEKLKGLDLSNCCKLMICPDFTSMPHIERLHFFRCLKLSRLHPSIWHLKWLTHLSLWGCESLEELPQKVGQLASLQVLEKLKVLDLSRCRNLMICPDFTSMPHLERLDFDCCWKLSRLHPSIWHLKCLTHLSLDECVSLTELPQKVGKLASLQVLEKLKVLKLRGCYKLMICPDFTSMPHLEKLDFGGCEKLSRLHPSIWHLKCLTHLSLEQCTSLKELPQKVGELASLQVFEKLKFLNLSNCYNLMVCPDFTSMPHLERLYFDCCTKLSRLHPSIGHLKCLTCLSLGGCESLEELPQVVGQLASLQVLRLDDCMGISTLPLEHGDLKSLRVLYLSRTNITSLPEPICSLPNLEVLNVADCRLLDSLPHSLGNLSSLRNLDFSCAAIRELLSSMLLLKNLELLRFHYCEQLNFSRGSFLNRLMVLTNRNGVSSATIGDGGQLSFDEPSERQPHSEILQLLPSQPTELSDPDDPKLDSNCKLDSIAKQLEALDLNRTLWLMDALAIDESDKLEARRLGRSLHGLLLQRFQESHFQHLLNWLISRRLGESSDA